MPNLMPDLRAWLRGLADLFTFGQLGPRLPDWWDADEPDAAALRSDWAAIGQDFRAAVEQYNDDVWGSQG